MKTRTERLFEEIQGAARKHEIDKSAEDKYLDIIENTKTALEQIKAVINRSRFIVLQSPLTILHLSDVLPYYNHLNYQLVSLNSKFSTLSETEVSLNMRLKQLAAELSSMRKNSFEFSQLTTHIDEMWTRLGRVSLVPESQYARALAELSNENKTDEGLIRSEECICVINLSGNEMARRMLCLLSLIEKHSNPLPTSLSSAISNMTAFLKTPGQKTVLIPPTPDVKKYRIPPARKSTYQTPLRTPLSLSSGVLYTRSASIEQDSELQDSQSFELVALGLGTDSIRDILTEELKNDHAAAKDITESVTSIFSETQVLRLFITKAKFRSILENVRNEDESQELSSRLVESLIREAHEVGMEKLQKQVELLRCLLTSVASVTKTCEQQLNEPHSTDIELCQKPGVQEPSERLKPSPALFDIKVGVLPFPFNRKSASQIIYPDVKLIPKRKSLGKFEESNMMTGGTDTEESKELFGLQTEREFFKTRGASLIPGLQPRGSRAKSTESKSGKSHRFAKTRKLSDLDREIVERTQAISQRMRTLMDFGTLYDRPGQTWIDFQSGSVQQCASTPQNRLSSDH